MNRKEPTKAQLLEEIKGLQSRLAEAETYRAESQQMMSALTRQMHALEERIRSLNFLYSLTNLLEQESLPQDEILWKTVEFIATSSIFPGRTHVRILFDDRVFETASLAAQPSKRRHPLIVNGDHKGFLEIFSDDDRPFTEIEKRLLDAIAGLLERIIEQRLTEKSLMESERRFRSLVENSPTGIFIVQDGRVVYENPEEKRLSGPLARLFDNGELDNIHEEDVEKVRTAFEDIISGKFSNIDLDFRFYQWSHDESDIDVKWVTCRASRIEYLGRHAVLVNKLDITRAKEMEHLLSVGDKMASLGRIASGIAHEIRNPLSALNLYLSNLEQIWHREGIPEQGMRALRQIHAASRKIESVIRRVIDFARPSEPKTVATDLNRLIEESIALSATTLSKSGVTVEKRLSPQLPHCPVDPHLMAQVMLNLITNAAEAMKNMNEDKHLEVASTVTDMHIVIRVSDSGPGIPMYMRKKIFDPFYTTKDGSAGIGLSLSRRIVADHGGALSVDTSKWGGSEFRIEIPLQKGEDGLAYLHH